MTINTTPVKDKRRLLRIKLKSLAAEATIIRQEEIKTLHSTRPDVQDIRREMYWHRVGHLRIESRCTLLAYSFIRGKKYRQVEPRTDLTAHPDWWNLSFKPKIIAMIHKYGSQKITGDLLDQWLEAEPQVPLPPRKPKVPYTGSKVPIDKYDDVPF